MTTRIQDDLHEWQRKASDGPALWRETWDRVRDLTSHWHDEIAVYPQEYVEGGAGLAMAIYLAAAESGIRPAEVHREAVVVVAAIPNWRDWVADWDMRLELLGHDVDDADDPVSECWRMLRRDCRPSQVILDRDTDETMSDSSIRWGAAISDTLPAVLSSGGADRRPLVF